jgi:hypothetical protein
MYADNDSTPASSESGNDFPTAGARLHGAHRTLAMGVLAATSRIVRQAARGEWCSVTFTAHQRRRLLQRLSDAEFTEGECSCVEALRQAVAESDDLIALLSRTEAKFGRGTRHV